MDGAEGIETLELANSTARRLILHSQGLDGRWQLPEGNEGVAQTVERLGYVQIDAISVVQRAHHHTLWVRRPDYEPRLLDDLLTHDRRVFEGWTHAASYLPLCDYRYYLPRMHARRSDAHQWFEQNEQLVEAVLDRIRAEGPLGATDFKAPDGWEQGMWWSRKPAKEALEMLLAVGDLMVARRDKFQRIYDLRERVLPDWVDTTDPDPDQVVRFRIRRSLAALGVASANEIQWRQGISRVVSEVLEGLTDAGDVVPVEVNGWQGKPCYALPETLGRVAGQTGGTVGVELLHILSPFDNLVICRPWLEKLFGFEYRIECFVPAAKRRYGYFVLPILWGERFVGRVDSKADRKRRTFIVRQLTFEPQVVDYDALLPILAEKLWAFAAFNNCERIVVEGVEPQRVKTNLERELEQSGEVIVTLPRARE